MTENADQPLPRQLRHDMRGRMNALKLCVAALDVDCTREESLEFLGDIEAMCDKIISLMDEIDALPQVRTEEQS